jgi:hypothetical protein
MSSFSENDVQRAAEIRDLLIKQISDKEEELDRLRDMLNLVDAVLKRSSFKPASTISKQEYDDKFQKEPPVQIERNHKDQRREDLIAGKVITAPGAPIVDNSSEIEEREIKELKRVKDSMLIANAEISFKSIKITPAEGLFLNVNTPPFRTFFLNRILDGMKLKDEEKIRSGEIKDYELLNYQVDNDVQGIIKSVTISNYREKERLQDILSTTTWVLSKMIEKGSQQTHG